MAMVSVDQSLRNTNATKLISCRTTSSIVVVANVETGVLKGIGDRGKIKSRFKKRNDKADAY